MNWAIIIIGNILMDSAIALFAIFSSLELKVIRYADEKSLKPIFREDIHKNEIKRLKKGAEFLSPMSGKFSILIICMFLFGIILQITGLIFD